MAATERPRRVRQDPKQRRQQLIGIGLEMLTKRPLHQVTIDEVAAQAGISRSLLFHYFPTKRDYYTEVVRAAGRRLLRALFDRNRPEATVNDVLAGYLDFLERRHEPYVALFRSPATDDWVHEVLAEIRTEMVAQLSATLHIDEPSDLLRATLGGWLSFAEELALDWVHHRAGSREQVLAVLVGGLTAVVAVAEEQERTSPRR